MGPEGKDSIRERFFPMRGGLILLFGSQAYAAVRLGSQLFIQSRKRRPEADRRGFQCTFRPGSGPLERDVDERLLDFVLILEAGRGIVAIMVIFRGGNPQGHRGRLQERPFCVFFIPVLSGPEELVPGRETAPDFFPSGDECDLVREERAAWNHIFLAVRVYRRQSQRNLLSGRRQGRDGRQVELAWLHPLVGGRNGLLYAGFRLCGRCDHPFGRGLADRCRGAFLSF